MPDNPLRGDMTPDEFRRYGHELIDWIANYLAHPERYPVLARTQPGDIKAQLPDSPPEQPETMDAILADFNHVIMPGITHWNHPGFFAYFANTSPGPSILGELLSAALNVNVMLWRTSPAATELEEVVLDWLRQLLGLPDGFSGVITDTASMSSLMAIAAAREAHDLDIRRRGMAGRADLPRLRLYTSEQSHSSIEKGAMTLGIGQEGVRKIPVDAEFRMIAEALARAIEEDIANGWHPFCVVATVGTTSTTSIDPVPAIAEICRQYDLWLHVDGAYGGTAAVVPEMRHVLDGSEYADSIVVNPHKWLFTSVDCSVFFVRDPHILKRAFSLVPEYLKTGQDEVNNYMDWGVQLGRRFRALKLWMVIRYFGHEGLAAHIREHIRLAQDLARQIDNDPDFERLAPTPFSTVCFRACPRDLAEQLRNTPSDTAQKMESYLDALNEVVMNAVNATGDAFLSHTRLNGRYTLRIAIGNMRTTHEHVHHAWQLVRSEAARLHAERRPMLEFDFSPK
jgi:aromatic-L-amino-acid decarboxylase